MTKSNNFYNNIINRMKVRNLIKLIYPEELIDFIYKNKLFSDCLNLRNLNNIILKIKSFKSEININIDDRIEELLCVILNFFIIIDELSLEKFLTDLNDDELFLIIQILTELEEKFNLKEKNLTFKIEKLTNILKFDLSCRIELLERGWV